jgi:hypothetical protein
MKVTKFQCAVCGKMTTGRVPGRGRGGYRGDLTFRFPRRHNGLDGKPCAGNIEEAIWVDFENGQVIKNYGT